MFRFRWLCPGLLAALLVLLPGAAHAQQSSARTDVEAQAPGRLLLVLPFETTLGSRIFDWIGEGAADIFNRRLDAAGFLTISRADRLYALDRLGLPFNFQPSRATTIRIAQLLDSDAVIVRTYAETGGQLEATAQILNLHQLTLSTPIQQGADLKTFLTR